MTHARKAACRGTRRLHATPMSRRAALLAAYDQQLRTEAETPGAVHITRLGPLRWRRIREGGVRHLPRSRRR